MSSAYLVVAAPEDARTVALEFSERRWLSLNIDLYDTALHVLVARLKSRTFAEVFASLRDLTPKVDGAETAESWDERFWVACIHLLPEDYLSAIVSVRDSDIPQVIAWWFGIEEFEHYRNYVRDFTEQAVAEDFQRIRAFLGAAENRSVLMRLST